MKKSDKSGYYKNVLQPTKQKNFNGKIYGFDIETCNKNKDFVCCSIYYDDNDYKIFRNKNDCINYIKGDKFKNSIIVASNLSFDFFGMFFKEKEMNKFNTLFRGSELIKAETFIRSRQFHKEARKRNEKGERYGIAGKRLTFIDTFNYCRMSVEKLGKLLNVPKLDKPDFLGEKPKTAKEWSILEEYNLRDSKISKLYLEFLYKTFEELGGTPKNTIASTSMELFKNKYLKDRYFRHKPEILDEIFKSYYGGRTEVFKRGSIANYYYYDFNSLYPSVMVDNKFPDPNSLRTTYKNELTYINNYEGCSEVDVFCPEMKYPFLPLKHNNKLLFLKGNFKGWYTHLELRHAIKLGYTIKKVYKTHYYKETCSPFNDFVKDLYKKRLEYDKDKNPMGQVCKLLLNAHYGKYGQKFRDRDNVVPLTHTLEELEKLDKFEIVGKDYIRITKKFSRPSVFCIPIWASYITAFARIKLQNAILDCEPVYCDTDSLITKKKLDVSNKLGDLKLEMKIKFGIIVKPKMYALVDDKNNEFVKIKGLPNKFNFMEFCDFLDNPTKTSQKFTKFKEAIRRNFIPNEIIDITKTLSLEDEKRLWFEKFDTSLLYDSEALTINNNETELDKRKFYKRKEIIKA